jgi:hypothetical protein
VFLKKVDAREKLPVICDCINFNPFILLRYWYPFRYLFVELVAMTNKIFDYAGYQADIPFTNRNS